MLTSSPGRSHPRLRIPLLLALALALLFAFPPGALANDGIEVLSSEVRNGYPSNIKFDLAAQSDGDIARITLRYKVGYRQTTSYANVEFQPGVRVEAQYVWNTQRNYVPPGVDLEYYWQIEDKAGNRAETAPAKVTVFDTRFDWQSVQSGQLTLYWYRGDERFARDLLDAGTRAVKQLSSDVGAELDRPVRMFVYEKQKDLLGALAPRDVEWAGGQAFPQDGVIALNADATPSGRAFGLRTVPHELSHLILNAATQNPFGGVPAWLDEGLAVYAEGPLEPQMARLLDQAVAGGTLLSLRSLSGKFPTDDRGARLAYAESYSAVKYLLGAYGREKMSDLLGVFREGSTADAALEAVYGWGVSGLEREWLASIGAKPVAEATQAPTTAATPAAPAAPAAITTPPSSSGRSCFGGLLLVASSFGGLLFAARKGIANESWDRV